MVEGRDALAGLLRHSYWLGRSAPGLATRLVQEGRVVSLPAGVWTHGEGDEATGLLVVIEGGLNIYCHVAGGRDVLISHLGPGAAIGQTIRLGGGPRLVTAICAEPSRLLIVGDGALNRIAHNSPEIWQAVASLTYLQMSVITRHLAETIALPPRQRLAARLIAMVASQRGDERQILRINQQVLAEMTGLTRKTVNAYLRAFERAGLVSLSYGRIAVPSSAALEQVASEP